MEQSFSGSISVGLLILIGVLGYSCTPKERHLFEYISPTQSGIHFSNDIQESEVFNILNFHYIYNGGGVGVGDFDQNGLPDLVFSGNQVASKIYLNQGDLNFRDVSEEANFLTTDWITGVSIVDLNGDGWQDIYLSVGGLECSGNCKNKLFVNQGLNANKVPTFKEMAEEFGLADGLYTQQAVFFDYDLDGDLDAYLLHNVIDKRDKNAPSEKQFIDERSIDQLFENKGSGKFVDVSRTMGITYRGYGLGVTISDLNGDFLPDIYVANDFLSDDLLYINRGKSNEQIQGFEEVGRKFLKHTSYNAMGVDIADVNNDALPDILVLDMLPESNERQKTMMGFMNYNKFTFSLRQGYMAQFVRNTLQIHNGFLAGELLPFSEVGHLAGVYHTDWSWTPLLADFNNDGYRDLFITNGYGKDITDLDFVNYSQTRSPFGTKAAQKKELYEVVRQMESIKMPNYIFQNQSDLTFQNQQGIWLEKRHSISNGAVYADLDADGDLDLIVNNINEPAYLLENQLEGEHSHYLKVILAGQPNNSSGIGSKVQIWIGKQTQYLYQSPVRGYLSTVEDILHFGIGSAGKVDSLKIFWPDGAEQIVQNIQSNQTIELKYSEASLLLNKDKKPTGSPSLFSSSSNLNDFSHTENEYQDFDVQPLLLSQHSRQGPCLVAADIDEKKGDELYIGGAKGIPSQILFQMGNGQYRSTSLSDPESEDVDAAFFDFDLDGDLDLYVVTGGVEFGEKAPEYQDRLYLNDGSGEFQRHKMDLPKYSGACVRPNDFDQDGDIDLWLGGRVIPGRFPETPHSYFLIHENNTFVELPIADKESNRLGMVTDGVWSDIDQDGWDDLILVGEWMPISIIKNTEGQLDIANPITIPNSEGMWFSLAKGDFDQDGDEDFLAGNLGANSRLEASPKNNLMLYTQDLDQNGSPDPFIGQYYLGANGQYRNYPLHARDDVIRQVPEIKNRYVQYATFGEATFWDLLGEEFTQAGVSIVQELRSVYIENKGNQEFVMKTLPQQAQLAPIQDVLVGDFDQDGFLDALLAGNDYTSEKNNGWYDAFNGLMLKGSGNGHFRPIPTSESGFLVPGDGRDIVKVHTKEGRELIVVGQNRGALLCFE